jgi:acyl carrier protein
MTMNNKEIIEHVRDVLEELFEISPSSVTLSSNLYDDLDIDSIDAVDLVDQIRRFTGTRVSMEDFRSVVTVQDLVTVIERLLAE